MSWYYAQANESKGPVPEAEFLELVRQGVIASNTLVWREGMPQWTPWINVRSEVLTAAGAQPGAVSPPLPTGQALCSVCMQAFPDEDLVLLSGRKVCAVCKPIQIQKMQEGAAGWAAPDPQASPGSGHPHGVLTTEDIEARDYEVPVMELFTAAANAVRNEPGTLLVAGILIMVVAWGIQVATVPFQLIPLLGQVIGMIIPSIFLGPILGGLVLTYLRHLRGEKISVGDVFCGFGPRFKKLAIAYFVPTMLSMLLFIPAMVMMGVLGFGIGMIPTPAGGGGMPAATSSVLLGMAASYFLGMFLYVYLTICWIYTLPLVADRNIHFWEAMSISRRVVSKHFWQHLWFFIFSWLVAVAGVFVCCVGVLVAIPVIALAGVMLYERLFHGLAATPPNQNP